MRGVRERIQLMLGRAIISLVNDATLVQEVQVEGLPKETLDGVERFQEYGFTSHPHPGAEALIAALGGSRQHPVVVATDDRRHRVKDLGEGETAIYTSQDKDGVKHRVHLKQGLVTEIHSGRSSIVMNDTTITLRAGNGAHVTLDAGIAGDGARIEWG